MLEFCGRVSLATSLLVIAIWIHGCHSSPEEDKLLTKLLASYQKYGRPGPKDKPLEISYRLSVLQIVNYEVATESVTIEVWEYYRWTDERLAWNVTGIANIRLPPDMIWTPDITPYNGWFGRKEDMLIVIYDDGACSWMPRGYITFPCTREGNSAHCSLQMGSWTYSGLLVNLTDIYNEIDTSNLREGRFELEGQSVKRLVTLFECCPEPYISINYNITVGFKMPLANTGCRVGGGLAGGLASSTLESVILMLFSISLIKLSRI